MTDKRVVVLISGSGSNLQAFIDAEKLNKLNGKVVAVISNKPNVFGLVRAQKANIPAHVVEHTQFPTRNTFDDKLAEIIQSYQPDLIILAGFMRILSETFVQTFNGKLLNIHPSLLPKYPGLHTHQRALANKDTYHGSSVHFVTEELDGGPVIAQIKLKLNHTNDESEVMQQVQQLEHQLYPEVASWFLTNRLLMKDNGVYFDNKKLEEPVIIESK
ncbi:phosphoribosylglycinamide formyltransferase [Aliikangiella sp. IMCC44359]|uniref:phosphoribosylglycinamide formyltransferase n=1 Tax=Aliikangiella sp. IMCC44359 TaxID=3459125 RepID=UPI00403A9CBD